MFDSFRRPAQKSLTEATVDQGRRKFILDATASVGTAAIVGIAAKSLYDFNQVETVAVQPELVEPEPFTPEVLTSPEVVPSELLQEMIGYSTLLPLRFDEVQFVDDRGVLIGDPVRLANIGDIDPGPLSEQGIPTEGISGRWLDAARIELQKQFPHIVVDTENGIPPQYNVGAQFRTALTEGADEPDLVSKIQSGDITRYIDIVNYFADKPVVGATEFTRFDYVQNEIVFRDNQMPRSIQTELRKLIPALCVQESGFNNDVTSDRGAQGIFQFIPDTWTGYGKDMADISSLRAQVEVAGEFFSDLYAQVHYWCGDEALAYLKVQCASQEAFEIELLVPLIINAFNAGARRMGDAVKEFVKSQQAQNTMLLANESFDLFASIIDMAETSQVGTLADYGEHARQYVPRIYGHSLALQELRNVKMAANE